MQLTGGSESDRAFAEAFKDGVGLCEHLAKLVKFEGGGVVLGSEDPVGVKARNVKAEAEPKRGCQRGEAW